MNDLNNRLPLVTFGELLLRYSPPFGTALADVRKLDVHVGGTEFNVAAAMAKLGHSTRLITALPSGSLGELARRTAGAHGVGLGGPMAAAGRMGVYYYEPGAAPRPGMVTYDRADSAFALHRWDEVEWSAALPDGGAFFTTGITASLSAHALDGMRVALAEAASRSLFVAFDVNYRAKLWSAVEARRTIAPLLEHVDCLFTARADAIDVLGAPADAPVSELLAWLAQRFGLSTVTMVYNPDSRDMEGPGEVPQWRAAAWHGGRYFVYDQPAPVHTVDRIGAGDAYAAGFLSALLNTGDAQTALQRGSALMALKCTYGGDFWPGQREELERLLQGGGSGGGSGAGGSVDR